MSSSPISVPSKIARATDSGEAFGTSRLRDISVSTGPARTAWTLTPCPAKRARKDCVKERDADEVADMLELTLGSVNSALKRARAGLQQRLPSIADRPRPPAVGSRSEQALVERFVRAYEAGDVDQLLAVLTDDVKVSMPPIPLEWQGRDVVARFYASVFRQARMYDLVPTRANGQPAFGAYLSRPDGGTRHGAGLIVLTLTGEQISALTRFDNSVLACFGLPLSLPPREP